MDERIVTNHELEADTFEKTIRPDSFDEYIGQTDVKENIKVFVKAAKIRNTNLDHVLLYGPPGLGKTTLAHIIANELGSNIKTASGPTIEKSGDLAAILSTLEPNDVLFIDEIHRIPRYIEEILYSAMEDFKLDIIIGSEGQSRSIKIDLPPFTLVGATTRAGDLSSPLRDRFGIVSKLEFYSNEELALIVKRTARVLNVEIDDESAYEIAIRSRKTPRIANRLLKRVSDFALVESDGKINIDVVKKAGGFTVYADTSANNLSKKITDEMVIIIYSENEIADYLATKEKEKKLEEKCNTDIIVNNSCIESSSDSKKDSDSIENNDKTDEEASSSNSDKNKQVSLNSASKEELMTLSGIGESKADAIIEYRKKKKFESIEEIKEVSGIGDALFEKIKDNITI